ncbi:hypothetical protein GGI11_001807 [Coemansia sp. RSA 2049]|nr:hypothetical protein GGI11_001807 [Coemansia sp. RSA 2049]
MSNNSNKVYSSVKDYYGKVLSSSKDLKTSACTAGSAPHPLIRDIIGKQVPDAVNERFYGCGNPIPLGIEGLDVLDLGSGSGRDCYVAAALVGPSGSVTGIDMTDEQLEVARDNVAAFGRTLGYRPNLRFVTGYIEELQAAGVEPRSVDLCISNCVVNLSPDKPAVLRGVYSSLRSGGELYFSDVYADADLPEALRTHDVLLGECIGGALHTDDFERIAADDVGFARPRILSAAHIEISDPELRALVGNTQFYSITYRLFKINSRSSADEQTREETTSAVATYLGTIPGHPDKYELDVDHAFAANEAAAVDSEVAAILAQSWLAKHFAVAEEAGNADAAAAATTVKKATPTSVLLQRAHKLAQTQRTAAAAAASANSGGSSGCCSGSAKKKCC